MKIFLYFKSGKKYDFIPQIRLTRSKNGITGTAIFELNLNNIEEIQDTNDPINGVALQNKNLLKKADICNFVWISGKPSKLIAVFIFVNFEEKQAFFDYYPNYALDNSLEFFPSVD